MKLKVFIILFIVIFMFGCSTNNEITNKTYDVDINIDEISEAFIPAAEKTIQSSIGVSTYVRGVVFTSWQLGSVGSGVVYYGYAELRDGTVIEDISQTKERNDVERYVYRAITNYHVVGVVGKDTITKVYLSKIDSLVEAKVLGYNIYEDLAVVEFSTTIYIPLIEFGNSDEVQTGEIVLAVGNPEGYQYSDSVSLGIISNPQRFVEVKRDTNRDGKNDWEGSCEYLQHDASINSGNSGGALVNVKGELIGINAMKLVDSSNTIEGMGFAIPINIVKKYLDDMENGKTITIKQIKGNIYNVNQILNKNLFKDVPNVDISNEYDYEYGVYVYNTNSFNLTSGDIIIELNGNIMYNVSILTETLRNDVSDNLIWKVFRDGKIIEIEYNK